MRKIDWPVPALRSQAEHHRKRGETELAELYEALTDAAHALAATKRCDRLCDAWPSCRCARPPAGWCDPDWNLEAGETRGRSVHVWHLYRHTDYGPDGLRAVCGEWDWEEAGDHQPWPAPPEGAKVCRRCRKAGGQP